MEKQERNYGPLHLVRNKSYSSYQLFAAIANRKTPPEEALKIAVLTAVDWLREKFSELDLPEELNYPRNDDCDGFSLSSLRSFRIDRGYVVDVVYIDEIKSWSLQLVEPDLGLGSKTEPVAGRIFTTDIAFRINNGVVECGFCTRVSDPEYVEKKASVFRLGVIKKLVRNPKLGLTQVTQLVEEPIRVDTSGKAEALRNLLLDENRQLPVVIFTEVCKDIPELPAEFGELSARVSLFDYSERLSCLTGSRSSAEPVVFTVREGLREPFKSRSEHPFGSLSAAQTEDKPEREKPEEEKAEPCYALPYDIAQFAHDRMGYAHVVSVAYDKLRDVSNALQLNIAAGDVCLAEPSVFGGKVTALPYSEYGSQEELLLESLAAVTQDYPLDKPVDYGSVLFSPAARLFQQEQLIRSGKSLENVIAAQTERESAIKAAYEKKLSDERAINRLQAEKISRLNDIIAEKERIAEAAKARAEQAAAECERQIKYSEMRLSYLESLSERPLFPAEIPAWVKKNFSDRMIFHRRAVDLITDTPPQELDMKLCCDALEYLATEYYDFYTQQISEDEANMRGSLKYQRPFIVTPSGERNIQFLPKEYKVKYTIEGTFAKETALSMHLKCGVASEHLLRIYFFYDNVKRVFVVGSLPRHLGTMSVH